MDTNMWEAGLGLDLEGWRTEETISRIRGWAAVRAAG